MRNKAILILCAIIVLVIGVYFFIVPQHTEGSGGGTGSDTIPPEMRSEVLPLNLSIYLDLSDRIKPNGSDALSQKDKDIAIVDFLANYVKNRAVKQKILPSKDRIKVFFYPEPADAKVALLSEKLELDLGITPMKEKKPKLISFTDEFKNSLEQIYSSTIQTSSWLGSDIWGFFNKPIDNYCIKDGYRNVLVILTDGYIYYGPNKQQRGNAYNYILNQTLINSNSSMIPGREGLPKLDNLEVLMLELNPNPLAYQPKMEQIIIDWLKTLGVNKLYVGETDVPSNTKMIIEKFMESNQNE